LRPALLTEVLKNLGNRVAREAITSSGASSRLAPERTEALPNCLPAEIGPSVACRALVAVAGLSGEAGTSVPIT